MKHVVVFLTYFFVISGCSSGAAVNQDAVDSDVDVVGLGSGHGDADSGDLFGLGDMKGRGDGYKTPPKPGEFGAPCTSNDDCISGYCIEGLDGYICTQICMEDCPDGYDCVGVNIGPDVVFICVPLLDRSCQLCSSDLQCSGGRCVEFGGGSYCLAPCEDSPCKESYTCQKVQVPGALEDLCMPASGTCECVPASIGLEKACKAKTGANICYGIQFCETTGWGECQLPDDVCDGKDNDCNGIVDDGMLNLQNGKYDTDEHCGACNNSCTAMIAQNSFGQCDGSQTLPVCKWACDNGHFDVNDNPNDGCECEYLSSTDDPDVPGDADCDGLDGTVSQGIFVAKNGNDGNSGTIDEPLLSVQQGIDAAGAASMPNVYIATGVYSESIAMVSGVHIYGGYSADFEIRDPAINQTVIMGMPYSTEKPGAVNCVDILDIPATLSGFHLFGGDAMEPGGSSYALYISNSNGAARFVSNWIIAGNGRDGTHGTDGSDGSDGIDGEPGEGAYDILKDQCNDQDWTAGGSGGFKQCGEANASGGSGGSGICPDYDESGAQPKSIPYDQSHTNSETGKAGSGAGPGSGGEPGYDGLISAGSSNCNICNVPKVPDGSQFLQSLGADGGDGAEGSSGFSAGGCVAPSGEVSGNLWVSTPGSWGGEGAHGSGGGGGGAGGGVETIDCQNANLMKYTDVGGSGGGGGSGGCRGSGAEGGSSGGGSFGIFVVGDPLATAVPVLDGNVIQTGFGGDGGDGGSGGVGGEGGKGDAGGGSGESEGSAWCADAGGHGGNGGNGGHGGGGGGGCGGPSFGIYLSGPNENLAADWSDNNDFVLSGAPGKGGSGGKSMGNAGSAGLDGADGETSF